MEYEVRLWQYEITPQNSYKKCDSLIFVEINNHFIQVKLFPDWLNVLGNYKWQHTFKRGLRDSSSVFCVPLLQFSRSVMSDSLQPPGLQHARLPCPSPFPRVCWSSCPLSWWGHPTVSSSITSFSSCPQSFPISGCFPVSQLFASNKYDWLFIPKDI